VRLFVLPIPRAAIKDLSQVRRHEPGEGGWLVLNGQEVGRLIAFGELHGSGLHPEQEL
jgi:hypothetical protein